VCVLTYIPNANGSITITHNRDEHVLRPRAIPPQVYLIENQKVIFPKDPLGGGTWFAQSDDWVVCLLNGAFEAHERKPKYRTSRGTIITDFFQNPDIQHFMHHFEVIGLEPFTFLAFDLKEKKVHQLVWDEKVLHFKNIDALQPHIWSSSTLYNTKIKAMRAKIFEQFVTIQPSAKQVIDFHKINIDNDLHKSFFVNIGENIKTVAITQVFCNKHKIKMNYETFY
jgi:uncharacterized protein with NRDE domain